MRTFLAIAVLGGGVAHATVGSALRIADVAPDIPLIVVVLLALRRGPEFGCGAQGAHVVNNWTGPGYRGSLPGRRDAAQQRIMTMSIVVIAALLVIVCQLWYLQVLEGGRFQEASDKNRIRIRPIAAPRGILFDRNGLPLVDNRPTFTLSLIPRGEGGGGRIEVDAMGRPVRLVQSAEPHPGAQVVTTVNRRVQEVAEKLMEGKTGAVVVMDPRNGDVLAMVSTPAFDIDRFTGTIDRDAWLRVMKDPEFPMLNRTIQSQYPPGSVFKMVIAAAGLQEGTLTPADRVHCQGEFPFGGRVFRDWKKEGHGSVDLMGAVAQSCDIFFYGAGLKVGAPAMTKYAAAFGFGIGTGIELGTEKFGLIPAPKSPRKGKPPVWHPGETVNMSIGQGQLLATPMQIARFRSAIANGGVLWKPRLVRRIERRERGVVWSDAGSVNGHVELNPAVWAFLRQSMWAVVNTPNGTGIAARIPGLDIAGKTGTAQTMANSKSEKGQDHAWFASFAPVRDPEVVIVVLVERGGHGGSVAAPIARAIYNAIFFEKVASLDISG